MKPVGWIVLAMIATVLAGLMSSLIGATTVSVSDLFSALFGTDGADETRRTILLQLRLPRVVTAAFVGGALAASGVGFQGLFRNPLAEPYIIGASAGAGLGVAIVVVSGLHLSVYSIGATGLLAVAGSTSVVFLVLAIAGLASPRSSTSLLLAGVVISSMINALVSALMFLFDQKAMVILSWLMGSLASTHWGTASLSIMLGGSGMILILLLSRALDVHALGETPSQSLGMDVNRFRWSIVAAASLATAGAVAASGIIGFVGLIAPHIARSLVGPRHANVIPLSIFLGAILLMGSDAVARTIIAPAELPVGIVTALLGCPFFLWLMFARSRTSQGDLAT